MDDISKEFEKEIAHSRPKPFKPNRKTRILIIDDFGQMKSGEYLKVVAAGLFFFSMICFVAAALFYYLYTDLSRETVDMETRLFSAESKVKNLVREKEVLIAKLVISGKDPRFENEVEEKKKDSSFGKVENKKEIVPKPDDGGKMKQPLSEGDDKNEVESENSQNSLLQEQSSDHSSQGVNKKTVSIEKFSVKKDGANGDLLIRFDIKNMARESGEVTGRIFAVLKPSSGMDNQWLVVPTSEIKNSVPSEYKKGKYFSIVHFKPMKFRIANPADPEFFKTASIYVFNEEGDLIFEELITITDAQ